MAGEEEEEEEEGDEEEEEGDEEEREDEKFDKIKIEKFSSQQKRKKKPSTPFPVDV